MVHGQKIFTTGATTPTTSGWPAAPTRTPPHKGISILIVDTRDPGYSWTPIITHDAPTTSTTYYDGVRVPVSMRSGRRTPAGGWSPRLNHERVMMGRRPARGLPTGAAWAAPGGRMGARCWSTDVRRALGRSYASQRINELLTAGRGDGAVASPMPRPPRSTHPSRCSGSPGAGGDRRRHGDPADPETAELSRWLDSRRKRNTVLTFGGGSTRPA